MVSSAQIKATKKYEDTKSISRYGSHDMYFCVYWSLISFCLILIKLLSLTFGIICIISGLQ